MILENKKGNILKALVSVNKCYYIFHQYFPNYFRSIQSVLFCMDLRYHKGKRVTLTGILKKNCLLGFRGLTVKIQAFWSCFRKLTSKVSDFVHIGGGKYLSKCHMWERL